MIRQIQSKTRTPKSLGYNHWMALPVSFPPGSGVGTPTAEYVPLPVNYKIVMVSYILNIVTPGLCFINVISGTNISGYEGSGAQSSHAYFTLSQTIAPPAPAFVSGDTITITVAGVPYVVSLSGRDTSTLAKTAQAVVTALSYNTAFNALYRANSLNDVIVVQTLTYSTATPTFAVSTNSANGTVTASGATMTAGVAGALPTQPVSDQTSLGIVPSGTAVANNALFPVDILFPVFGQTGLVTGTLYCYENYDSIWPSSSILAAVGNQPGTGSIDIIQMNLWGVPMDNHPMQPQEGNGLFQLGPNLL